MAVTGRKSGGGEEVLRGSLRVITTGLPRVSRAAMRRALSSTRRPGRHLDALVVRELRSRRDVAEDGVSVDRSIEADAVVLSVSGEIDLATAPALRDALRAE